jgi:ABC-type transport system substrate-binding protein
VDLVQNGIPALMLESVLKAGGLDDKKTDGTVMTYLGMNLTDPVLSNAKVRRAIAYAIDRDEIISHRFKSVPFQGRIVQASFIPQGKTFVHIFCKEVT